MKKLMAIVSGALIMGMLFTGTVRAETLQDEYVDENYDLTDIEINMEAGDDFSEDVTVYFDSIPVRLSYDAEESGRGYKTVRSVLEGTHKISVMSITDYEKRYSFSYPEQFATSEGRLDIQVIDHGLASPADDTGECEHHEQLRYADEYEMDSSIDVPVLDFAEDGYAVIDVGCGYCPAVESLVFTLRGEETYDIALYRDSFFRARVLVPAGTYQEMPLKSIEFDQDACADQYRYMLSHSGDGAFYGRSYEVDEGDELEITDLQILMNIDGQCIEIDSNLLFAPTLINNSNSVIEDNFKQYIEESAASVPDEAVETIAVAEPIVIAEENEKEHTSALPICIAAFAAIVLAVILVIMRRRGRD